MRSWLLGALVLLLVLVGMMVMNTPSATTAIPSVSVTRSSYRVVGTPTITTFFIEKVLHASHSPAAGHGQALSALGVRYGIDPAVALAFFWHESTFGTAGEARRSLSLGNLRCLPNFKCQDGYAWFPTWEDGFEAWYQLIRNLYVVSWGLTTIDQIIPRYAPTSDNNDVAAYIAALKHALDTWRRGEVLV